VSRRLILSLVVAIVVLAVVDFVLAHVGGGHGIQSLF
jgi:hypothetical protein